VLVYWATSTRQARTSTATSFERADCFDDVLRIALSHEQIQTYDLPPQSARRMTPRAVEVEP
jgi:hypothetical protein